MKPAWHFEQSPPDCIVLGEGESTVVELLEELEKRNPDISRIPGLAYLHASGELVHTGTAQRVPKLDTPWCIDKVLTNQDGSSRYIERHTRKSPVYAASEFEDTVPTFAFYGSRGCALRCPYCATSARDGRTVRHMGASRMFADFLDARERYGAVVFYNQSDTFGAHEEDWVFLQKVRDYSERVGDHGFVVNNPNAFFVDSFLSFSPTISVDAAFIGLLQGARCNVVTLAVETSVQRFSKKLDWRKVNVELIIEICAELRARKIRTDIYMMYGFPGQEETEFDQDLEMARRLSDHCDSVTWHCFTLLPGTAYYEWAIRSGAVSEKEYRTSVKEGYGFFYPVDQFNLSKVSTKKLFESVKEFGPGWS